MSGQQRGAARDIIAGVLDRDMLGAEPRGTAYEEADRVLAALQAMQPQTPDRVLVAALAVARSEVGANLDGSSDTIEFESWPEMDELFAALDEAQPGWRAAAPEADNGR